MGTREVGIVELKSVLSGVHFRHTYIVLLDLCAGTADSFEGGGYSRGRPIGGFIMV